MTQAMMKVRLLASTPNKKALIYAAMVQCYSAKDASDIWDQLMAGEISEEKQQALIERVLSSGHESPLEHVSFTFAISGFSRISSQQVTRHRHSSPSQQSQRYVSAIDCSRIVPPAVARNQEALAQFDAAMEGVSTVYEKVRDALIAAGIPEKQANEDARFVLPNAAETKFVITMNVRSLLHFFGLRCCLRAQWEVRELSNRMLALCRDEAPVLFDQAGARCIALGYCPEDPRFSCGRVPTLQSLRDSQRQLRDVRSALITLHTHTSSLNGYLGKTGEAVLDQVSTAIESTKAA